jgi:hypothetical protein
VLRPSVRRDATVAMLGHRDGQRYELFGLGVEGAVGEHRLAEIAVAGKHAGDLLTQTVPYDVEARLEWSPTVGKLAVRKICCTALPGGDDVSPTGIARIALRDTIQTALQTEYLGGTGWPGLLDKHAKHDPLAVDALIYLLAVAFQSPKPTATVALARGLSPASGPKRILAARKAGLLPETEPGKPAGA